MQENQKEDELYWGSITAIRNRDYQEAQAKLESLLKRKSANRRAQIILGCLLIREECEKLIQTTKE